MLNRTWPSFAKFIDGTPSVDAHSRGGEGSSGHYAFARAPGAMWHWRATVVPLVTLQALQLRALLHSLRGPSGTVSVPAPNRGVTVSTTVVTTPAAPFTDGTLYSDGTTFVELVTPPVAAGSEALPLASAAGAQVGDFMTVVTAAGSQVVRVAKIAGLSVTVRPRVRAAVSSGAAVQIGAVFLLMRLRASAPVIPLLNGRSVPFVVELEEVY